MRDSELSRTYEAEDAVVVGTVVADRIGLPAVNVLAVRLFHTDWWSTTAGVTPVLTASRADSKTSRAIISPDRPAGEIRLSVSGETCGTFVHEAAHIAQRRLERSGRTDADPGHGRWFRSVHVDVMALMCGWELADKLRDGYVKAGLAVPDRRWTRPDPTHVRGIYGRWLLDRTVDQINKLDQGMPDQKFRTESGTIAL